MGNRPKVWNFRTPRRDGWAIKRKDITNDISKYDVERLDLLPFVESKPALKYRWNMISPIKNYLMGQIGRDYDVVFSDMLKKIPKKYRKRVSLDTYKMPSSFHPEATRWFLEDRQWFRDEPIEGFYVDLETRVLGYIAPEFTRVEVDAANRAKPVYKPLSMDKFKIRLDYGQHYTFQQLLTYDDFVQEAFKMKHCIKTYWNQCTYFDNKTSIWSLSVTNEKKLTIQINNRHIVQVRGQKNRRAVDAEKKIVQDWAEWVGFTIADWAF